MDDRVAFALIAIGGLALVYMMVLRPKARSAKRRDPLATSPGQRQSLAAERSAERQMQSLVLELEQLSRQMGSQLDTKAAKLQQLIDDADDAAKRLQAAVQEARQAPAVDRDRAGELAGVLAEAVTAGRSGRTDSGLAGLDRHRDIYALADEGKAVPEIARRTNRPAGEVELILALRD
jgi:hypothetical protein